MNLLMIGGDQSILRGEQGPYWYTLQDLSKQFDRIDVFCAQVKDPVLSFFQPIHGNVYLHPCPVHKLFAKRWIQSHAKKLHKTVLFDRITVHAYPPFIHFFAGLHLQRALQVPVVCEWHGVHSLRNSSSLQDVIGALLTRLFAKQSNQCNSVRTVSSSVSRKLEQFGVQPSKISLLPAVYIDPTIWQVSTSKKRYNIVYSGRIDANKRLDRIIQALTHLPNFSLVVIGDGPNKMACEQLAKRLQVNKRITWLGWLKTPQEVATIIQQSEVLCMPSGYEGGPRVVVEALATGTPVVATNVGIVPDVVVSGKNGIISKGTVSDLVQDITKVITEQSFSMAAQESALTITQRFSRDQLIGDYSKWLKQAS